MNNLTLCLLTYEWIEPYLQQFSPIVQRLLKVKEKRSECQYLIERISQQVSFFFVLVLNHTQLIGALEIRDPACRSQLYCWLNEQWWGTGYFQQAIKEASTYYFVQTDESYISACIDIDNTRSFRALVKAGFIQKAIRFNQYEMILLRNYCV